MRRAAITGAIGAVLALAALAVPAGAAPRWAVAPTPDGGALLRLHLDAPLPLVDGRPEVRAGTARLGTAAVVGDELVLRVAALPRGGTAALSAWLGSRRLDGPTPAPARRAALRRATDATAPVGTAVASDPGAPGPYATERRSYTQPGIRIAPFPARVEVAGEVTLPVGAPGARPLVLLLHGRHSTCSRGDDATGDWPCRRGWTPIPSERGYRRIADLLASQGDVVVSIAANGINGQDYAIADGGADARARLVAHHLDLWSRWSTVGDGPLGDLRGRVDTTRAILMGHSRGGEGVARAAAMATGAELWRVRGLVLIAPTDFARAPVLGIPSAVLLPSCDGDVSDLQGQAYVDAGRDVAPGDTALRASVLVEGANHNAFNAEWMPATASAPAFDDSTCAGEAWRLPGRAQRDVGATYVAALVHVALEGDADAAALLDGSAVHAPSAGAARVRSSALGGVRALAFAAAGGAAPTASGVVTRSCVGWDDAPAGGPPACLAVPSPHFVPAASPEPLAPRALALRWTAAGGTVTLPAGDLARGGATHLDLRAIVGGASPPVALDVAAIDAGGTAWPLGRVRASRLLGPGELPTSWAQTLRLPLPASPALPALRSIRLSPATPRGSVVLLDAHLRAAGAPAPAPLALPRVDVTRVVVPEGSARHLVQVPLSVTGVVPAGGVRVRVAVIAADYSTVRGRTVTIPAGATQVAVPVAVPGNRTWDSAPSGPTLAVFPLAGARTGDALRAVEVTEDDPKPAVVIAPRRITVREGGAARIRIRLTHPVTDATIGVSAVRLPAGLRPLRLADISQDGWGVDALFPGRTLARLHLGTYAAFDRSRSSAVITLRPVRDGVAEGPERVLLRLSSAFGPSRVLPRPVDVLVTVRDA